MARKTTSEKPASGQPAAHCVHDAMVAIEKITPNPRNPNKHGPEQIALLAEMIKHRGWRNSIQVSNRSGFIVAGHGRLAAAKLLKLDLAPVDYQDFESDADEWAHMIADNRIAELAEIDAKELEGLLKDVGESMDIRFAGFDELPELGGEEEPAEVAFSEAIMESNNYVVLTFDNDIDWLSAQTHFELETVAAKRQNGKPWSKGIGRVLQGGEYLRKLTKE